MRCFMKPYLRSFAACLHMLASFVPNLMRCLRFNLWFSFGIACYIYESVSCFEWIFSSGFSLDPEGGDSDFAASPFSDKDIRRKFIGKASFYHLIEPYTWDVLVHHYYTLLSSFKYFVLWQILLVIDH